MPRAYIQGMDTTKPTSLLVYAKGGDYSGHNLTAEYIGERDLNYTTFDNAVLQGTSFIYEDDPDLFSMGPSMIGASFYKADMRNCKLRFADLRAAHLNGVNAQGADMSETDFMGASLGPSYDPESIRVNLRDAILHSTDFRGADLNDADLRGADLNGADLRGAYLNGADLRGADLTGADLRGANLNGANLRGADLRGADLTGVDLTGVDLDKRIRAYIKIHNARI
jgi:uncharacterized protein YjbI with pentapeptide repeats